MRRVIFYWTIAALATAVVVGGAASAGAAGSDVVKPVEYPAPPWELEDGTIDPAKVPDRIPIFDQSGDVCGYMSREEFLAGPPVQWAQDGTDPATRRVVTLDENGFAHEVALVPPMALC